MPEIKLRYFGISAFELTSERGIKVLIDPCITGIHGIKFSPVGLEAFTDLDVILVSHGAHDHLGDTLELAKQTGCDVMAGADVSTHLARNGIDKKKTMPMIWGNVNDYKGLRIRAVESHHRSAIEYTEGGWLSSAPLGFIVYTESGLGIYHPGDTSIFGDLKLFGELYRPKIGLLPVGMPVMNGGKHLLSPEEAAMVTKWMGLKLVIPTHYAQNSPNPQDFALYVHRESPDTRVVIMNPGEEIVYQI